MSGLEPGYQLGHYRITRSLGSGGMADVYEAQDDHLDRIVALKVLPMEYCRNPQLVQRFQKEVRAAAKLNHRNIVTVFEVGQQDSWHFFSMRLLTGGDLRKRIEQGLTPVESLAILREVADAFAHAHARGFVHRDVKPENIMFDEQGFPVLTDFGIAKALDANTHMTRTGMTMGTPRYLSPEQASGKPVDARADLYSLGIILHEMLTGRPPYDAEESMAVIFKHVTEPIPLLPPDFERYQPLLEKLMAKDPNQRIASAADLIREIDAIVPRTATAELKQSQLRTSENPLIAHLLTPSPLRTPAPKTPRPMTPPPVAKEPPAPVEREMTGEVAVRTPPVTTRRPTPPPAAAPRSEGVVVRPVPAPRTQAAPAAPAAGRRAAPLLMGGTLAAAALAGAAFFVLKSPLQTPAVTAPASVPAAAQPDAAAEAARAEAARRDQARQDQLRKDAGQKQQATAELKSRQQAEAKQRADQDAQKKAAADLQARQQAEAQAKQRADEQAAQKKTAELQARQQAEAEAKKRAEAQAEADARRRAEAEAEARRRAEAEEAARRKAAAEPAVATPSTAEEIERTARERDRAAAAARNGGKKKVEEKKAAEKPAEPAEKTADKDEEEQKALERARRPTGF